LLLLRSAKLVHDATRKVPAGGCRLMEDGAMMKSIVASGAATMMAAALALGLSGTALAGTVVLTATLTGANETAGGDADGSGKFRAEIDPDAGDVCYTLTAKGIDKVTMAHIHEGAAGSDGKPLGRIDVTTEGDECLAMEPEVLTKIVATPGDYYVNIHTNAYPKGAVRGQLAK